MNRRSPPAKTGWRRHVEGWQLALVLMVSPVVPALLAVPPSTVSRELPLPSIDRAEQRRTSEAEAALARQQELPYAVRSVGEALRRFGALRARKEEQAAGWALTDVHDAVEIARRDQGLPGLSQLRAIQTGLFLDATDHIESESSLQSDPNLLELGGEFVDDARKTGWLGPGGLRATRDELRAWFVIRWNATTQLGKEPQFAPSLNEWRTYYRFLLRDDHVSPDAAWEDVVAYRARAVTALAQKDPDYPVDLALGILSCQRNDYTSCANALGRHLQRWPEGAWSLRARSTLKVALGVVGVQEPMDSFE
jgi:hypothetical protein